MFAIGKFKAKVKFGRVPAPNSKAKGSITRVVDFSLDYDVRQGLLVYAEVENVQEMFKSGEFPYLSKTVILPNPDEIFISDLSVIRTRNIDNALFKNWLKTYKYHKDLIVQKYQNIVAQAYADTLRQKGFI